MNPRLRAARFDDYEQIVRLEAKLSAEAPSVDDWRLLWQGSPLWPQIEKTWPIGWVLETDGGEIVGSIGNIPLGYHFQGEYLIATTGRGWVVAPQYRGFALWLLDERFNQPLVDLFMDTTISPLALDAFNEFSHRVPAGDWGTVAYYVTGHRAFAKRALQKLNVPLASACAPVAGAALHLKEIIFGKALPKARASFAIEEADRFDSRFDSLWRELLRQNPDTLLGARDAATLTWHFSVAIRRRRVWIFTASRNRQLIAYCLFKRQDTSKEIPRMRLVDYQNIDPEFDLLGDFLAVALRRCIVERVGVLDKPGVGLTKMRIFDEYAAYRAKQTWPFFYRAVDPGLAAQLCQPKFWDPSAYDGDASIE